MSISNKNCPPYNWRVPVLGWPVLQQFYARAYILVLIQRAQRSKFGHQILLNGHVLVCFFICIKRNKCTENSTCLRTYTLYYAVSWRVEFSVHLFCLVCMKTQNDTHDSTVSTRTKCTSAYMKFVKKNGRQTDKIVHFRQKSASLRLERVNWNRWRNAVQGKKNPPDKLRTTTWLGVHGTNTCRTNRWMAQNSGFLFFF